MADLDSLQASQSVKIAGADSSGSETNYVNSTAAGEIKAADIINVSVPQALLSVSTTAVEVKAGASRLATRKSVMIQAQGSNIVYGFTSASQIFTIPNGTTVVISLGDNVGIWVRRTIATAVPVAIAELA